MMRSRFDEQLAQLHRELIEMGALCERVIALASRALTTGDKSLAQQVPPLDRERQRGRLCPTGRGAGGEGRRR